MDLPGLQEEIAFKGILDDAVINSFIGYADAVTSVSQVSFEQFVFDID
jgi:hypothetical protein